MSPKVSEAAATRLLGWLRGFICSWVAGWNLFWFTPRAAETLALIRICCGAMITYIHCIWLSQLTSFMGTGAWIDGPTIRELHQQDWAWSWLFYVESPTLLFAHQMVAIVAGLCMTLGLVTRIAVPVTWWMTLMVCHRMTGALFGLDQVVMMLTTYLIWSRCGSVWSLDARLARPVSSLAPNQSQSPPRPAGSSKQAKPQSSKLTRAATPGAAGRLGRLLLPTAVPCTANNISTRLIQLHLCVIYVFGGLSKMRGEMWWDGSAMWFSIVNYEYQTLNLTWLGHFPFLIGLLTAVTIFWETYYCALVWPRLTRPIALGLAFLVHGGICVALGMWTFGTMMIVANTVFISPDRIRSLASRVLIGRVTPYG